MTIQAMENLIIEGTDDTPEVIFNRVEGTIKLSGMSLPEDVNEFYKPVISWLKEYFQEPNTNTEVFFNMTYFNTASSKIFLDMLYIFKKAIEYSHHDRVIWSYDEDDEEMQESGEDYAEIVGIDIELKGITVSQM